MPSSLLATFDGPSQAPNCDKRGNSTAAPQALMLMNGDFVRTHAERFARRVLAEAPAERIARAWRIAYQRDASAAERDLASRFLTRQAARGEVAAWTNLCQQLLSSNEFLYVD